MEHNEFTLRKIPLKIFIDTLINVYNEGVNFIDLIGTTDPKQDFIGINVREDYISSSELEEDNKLSIDDLNQLIY